jgi:uncharacterized protein
MTVTIDTVDVPVAATERIDVLDVLRGVAVLGILLVNIDSFLGYGMAPPVGTPPGARYDRIAAFLVEFLVQGKFYCLFSFLFGVGFAVFIARATARGRDAVALFKRRLVALLLIGGVHTFLIWYGDILTNYAVIGFALIPFLRRDDRAVLRAALLWLASPVAFYLVLLALARFVPAGPASGGGDGLPPFLVAALESFAHGSYPAVVKGNVIFTIANVVRRIVLMFYPRVFGMFLLGFYAGRVNFFAHLETHAALLRRICAFGFAVGLPLAFIGAAMGDSGSPRLPSASGLVEMAVETIATPALALAYAAGICLMYRSARTLMLVVAPVGRMALSSYLTHSVAGVLAFYGMGLGYYGQVSLTVGLALCFAMFAVQIVASRLWLSVAAFGPAEWLWRCITYRRFFALLRATAPPSPR